MWLLYNLVFSPKRRALPVGKPNRSTNLQLRSEPQVVDRRIVGHVLQSEPASGTQQTVNNCLFVFGKIITAIPIGIKNVCGVGRKVTHRLILLTLNVIKHASVTLLGGIHLSNGYCFALSMTIVVLPVERKSRFRSIT